MSYLLAVWFKGLWGTEARRSLQSDGVGEWNAIVLYYVSYRIAVFYVLLMDRKKKKERWRGLKKEGKWMNNSRRDKRGDGKVERESWESQERIIGRMKERGEVHLTTNFHHRKCMYKCFLFAFVFRCSGDLLWDQLFWSLKQEKQMVLEWWMIEVLGIISYFLCLSFLQCLACR